ncbi:MAG: exodeoxyribonuclease VII small subunit [Victivallales bacterium]|nr:exodeoxyribonuclease VII small subunit [Victivallales bacterium]
METPVENTPATAEQPVKFEEALARLENIVFQLESGQLSLEESIARFEEGVKLGKLCREKLGQAQEKIEVLVKNADGTLGWGNFTPPQP